MAIVILEHSDSAGAKRLGATLRDYGHRLRRVALHEDEPVPGDLDDVDGVVTMGGPQSVLEDHPWKEPEMAFLKAAHAQELAIVGVCLGCQILGASLGGAVGRVEGGIELGWQEVSLTPAGAEDPLFTGIPWKTELPHWHREQVSKLPPGARVLARSKRCPVQAWAIGVRTYAFQFHPEAVRTSLDGWAADDPDALNEAGVSPAKLREDTMRFYPAFERLTDRLFESMALYLLPADRRIRGVVKDLHH